MALTKINDRSGYSVDLSSYATSTDLNNLTTGKVLQTQSYNYGDRWTTTSSTMTQTPLTVSITPSSTSSKILVTISVLGSSGSGSVSMQWQVRRGSSTVIMPNTSQTLSTRNEAFMIYQNGDNNVSRTNSFTYLDSPSSTSALTYTLYVKGQAGNQATLNSAHSYADNSSHGHVGSSTITVMEIAG